ncbi:hypothetical protein EDD36DRAFT_35704 [Exophiala viscosa]|uniref:C2H2-type domain-containing protein n=1 Tax=Exophiala viscosa TaxID=2486360 RepID=A0AAN6E8D6_9EURO|nr:hypothetical protein EDD36DRAFT_35704 [Exophiala viscosa]
MASGSRLGYQQGSGRVRVDSDPFILLHHAGGATLLDTASAADTDLIGVQSQLPGMNSASDDTSTIYPSPAGYHSSEYSDPFMPSLSSDDSQGNFQYLAPDSDLNSPLSPSSQHTPLQAVGDSSHNSSSLQLQSQPGDQGPWTQLDVFRRRSSPLPDNTTTHLLEHPQRLNTPTHRPRHSSASGEVSNGDSGYFTGSRKSHHGFESVTGLFGEQMDPREQNYTQVPQFNIPQGAGYVSSASATIITQADYNHNNLPPPPYTLTPQDIQPAQENMALYCPECDWHAKTNSDFKKHNARHERRHVCPLSGCSRKGKGFATSNDLDRHLKTVHQINRRRGSKYFKCFSEGCTKADKQWPRQDNFKQHLIKMHPGEDVEVLLRISNDWFAQHGHQAHNEPQDDTQSNTAPDEMDIDSSNVSVTQQFPAYPADNFMFPMGNALQHEFNLNSQPFDPGFAVTPTPRHTTRGQHRRRVSTSATGSRPQAQFPLPPLDTSNVGQFSTPMQRTKSSQAYQLQYPDAGPFQSNTLYHVGHVSISDSSWTNLEPYLPNMRPDYPVKYTVENQQIFRTKGPHTVANPSFDVNRMTDVPSPLEPQPSMLNELRGQQDDFLMNTTGGVASESVTPISPQQSFQCKITPPDNEGKPNEAELTRLRDLAEDIHKFVDDYKKSKPDSPLPIEDIFSRVRLTMGSLSSVGSSSVSRVTGEADTESAVSKTSPITREGVHVCPVCRKTKKRPSELKKHMQRHEKPYGCTHDGCYGKTFGSKSDWQRHERGCTIMPQQQDCWRCFKCHDVCWDQGEYIRHMINVHSIKQVEKTPYSPRHQRIARNYEGPFWCGFCNKIIPLPHQKQGVEAFNLRSDHIAEHFTKEKKSIKDWIELTGHGMTKELRSKEGQGQNPSSAIAIQEDDNCILSPELESAGTQSSSSMQSGMFGEQVFYPQSQSSSLGIVGFNNHQQLQFSNPFQSLLQQQQIMTGQMEMSTAGRQAPGQMNPMHAHADPARQRRHHQQPRKRTQQLAQSVECCQCSVPANVMLSKVCICDHLFCDFCKYRGAPKDDH